MVGAREGARAQITRSVWESPISTAEAGRLGKLGISTIRNRALPARFCLRQRLTCFAILTGFQFFLLAGFSTSDLGHPLAGVHGAAALLGTAVAGRGILVVIQVVIPDEFFPSGDVAQC